MDISKFKKSNFLTKNDIDGPTTVTINRVTEEAVGLPSEQKAVTHFDEMAKGLVTNMTNLESIADIAGSRNTDDWLGTKVELYVDEGVRNLQGMRVGGLRVRAVLTEKFEDEIPYEHDRTAR